MKLSVIFTVLNQLRIDHWQTKSYAQHKALATAYESLEELFDTYIELLYGRNGIPTPSTVYNIKLESVTDNLIARYTQMRDKVIEYLKDVSSNYGDLKNTTDEIEAEFNRLLYRLQQE